MALFTGSARVVAFTDVSPPGWVACLRCGAAVATDLVDRHELWHTRGEG